MKAIVVPDPAYLYHITHVDNLPGIIESGGLLANNSVAEGGYVNIAHESIQLRRHSKRVPCGPGGLLHDSHHFILAAHAVAKVQSWNSRKAKLMQAKHIQKAFKRLQDQQWFY